MLSIYHFKKDVLIIEDVCQNKGTKKHIHTENEKRK